GNLDSTQPHSQGTINQTGGILRIENGSTLFLSANGSSGVYNLNGGTLQVGGSGLQKNFGQIPPNYQFNLGGGTIQVIGASLVTNVDATLTNGISTIDTNGLGATFSGNLSGLGALAKEGAGTLVLSGVNSYIGGTFVNAGVLDANGSLSSLVTVNSGG